MTFAYYEIQTKNMLEKINELEHLRQSLIKERDYYYDNCKTEQRENEQLNRELQATKALLKSECLAKQKLESENAHLVEMLTLGCKARRNDGIPTIFERIENIERALYTNTAWLP